MRGCTATLASTLEAAALLTAQRVLARAAHHVSDHGRGEIGRPHGHHQGERTNGKELNGVHAAPALKRCSREQDHNEPQDGKNCEAEDTGGLSTRIRFGWWWRGLTCLQVAVR